MITDQRVLTVTEATFDRAVLQARLPVLVDFWAGWCPPCKWLDPVVEEIAAEQAGRLLVAKVDADENPGLVRRYGTLSLPKPAGVCRRGRTAPDRRSQAQGPAPHRAGRVSPRASSVGPGARQPGRRLGTGQRAAATSRAGSPARSKALSSAIRGYPEDQATRADRRRAGGGGEGI